MSFESQARKTRAMVGLCIGGGIAVLALIVLLVSSGWIMRSLRGPASLSADDVKALDGKTVDSDREVSIAFDEIIDTKLIFARVDGAGNQEVLRHYYLGRLGDRWLIVSERPNSKANPLTGTLEKWEGKKQEEAISQLKSKYPQHAAKFLSFQMRAEESSGVGAGLFLAVCGLAFLGGLIFAGVSLYTYMRADEGAKPRARKRRRRSRQQEYDFDDDEF